MNPKFQIATDYMRQHLDQKLPLSKLTDSVALSSSQLCYIFKTETGKSPMQYLTKLKMDRAIELLDAPMFSIKEVMVNVGYTNASLFSRHFKKAHGVSPSKYREQNRVIFPDGTDRQTVISDNKSED
ncbi:MAG TPA: AraC family transcriptional regulator [Blastocatellia bacterium]|nr:AraC family transcriptional regulator [Blastocatellia bacterium]